MTRTCDLRFRKPFSRQRCQGVRGAVLQMLPAGRLVILHEDAVAGNDGLLGRV
jgi:hypothetical protein